jgi:hypothetical protein
MKMMMFRGGMWDSKTNVPYCYHTIYTIHCRGRDKREADTEKEEMVSHDVASIRIPTVGLLVCTTVLYLHRTLRYNPFTYHVHVLDLF